MRMYIRSGHLIRYLLVAVLMSFANAEPAAADIEAHSEELALWTPVSLHLPGYRNFYPTFEVQPRLGSELRNLDQLLIRPRVDYRFSERTYVGLGYLWRLSNTPGSPVNYENQIFQQAGYRLNIDRLRLIGRFRCEERFIQGTADMSTRLRFLARLEYALGMRKKWSAVFWSELFVNPYTVNGGPVSGMDQTRFFFGARRSITKRMVLEIGYQPVITNPQQPTIDQFGHVIITSLDIAL